MDLKIKYKKFGLGFYFKNELTTVRQDDFLSNVTYRNKNIGRQCDV